MNRRQFIKNILIGATVATAPKFIFDVGANLYKREVRNPYADLILSLDEGIDMVGDQPFLICPHDTWVKLTRIHDQVGIAAQKKWYDCVEGLSERCRTDVEPQFQITPIWNHEFGV